MSVENYPSTPTPDEFEYRLLTGHRRTDGSEKSSEALRMEYINLTDKLIHQMTDGVDITDPVTYEKETRVPDAVVFLDKSARPLAWLTRELWDRLAPEPGSDEIPPMPDMKFLNIDREQWVNAVDPDGHGYMDISKIDPSIIRSLRSIFVSPQDKQDGITEAIDDAPASLDNKTIMVVDEVSSTGRTLSIATKMIQRAFPSAHVGGAHWMDGMARKGSAVGNADLPVWYKEDDEYGRGVGDRAHDHPDRRSDNLTQRLGSWFLSTRFAKPDGKALQLRREIKHLAEHPDVPIRPSYERDDVFERLETLNGDRPAGKVLASINEILDKNRSRR